MWHLDGFLGTLLCVKVEDHLWFSHSFSWWTFGLFSTTASTNNASTNIFSKICAHIFDSVLSTNSQEWDHCVKGCAPIHIANCSPEGLSYFRASKVFSQPSFLFNHGRANTASVPSWGLWKAGKLQAVSSGSSLRVKRLRWVIRLKSPSQGWPREQDHSY